MIKYVIKNLHFVQSSNAYPEQYDVLDHLGRAAGYVRLRHGYLYCAYPQVGGEVIYSCNPQGADGEFVSEAQRQEHLTAIARAIAAKRKQIRDANKKKYARKVRQCA